MKKIIAILCLAFSTLASSAETGSNREEIKLKMAQYIDNEIGILTQFKACIQAAQTATAFDTCKNIKNAAQEKKVLEMKRDRLENRKKQLAAKEKHLNETAKINKK